MGDDRQRAQLSVGTSSEVSLKVTEADIGSLTATIKKPSGAEEPCQLKRLANGHLGTMTSDYGVLSQCNILLHLNSCLKKMC